MKRRIACQCFAIICKKKYFYWFFRKVTGLKNAFVLVILYQSASPNRVVYPIWWVKTAVLLKVGFLLNI